MVIRHHLVVIYIMLDIYQKFQKWGKLDEDGDEDNKFPKYLPLSLVLVP